MWKYRGFVSSLMLLTLVLLLLNGLEVIIFFLYESLYIYVLRNYENLIIHRCMSVFV